MNTLKNNITFKIGTFIGILTLTIGLGIFLTWWVARAFFVVDFYTLEGYGFIWIIISVPLATIGFIMNFIYLIKNYKTNFKKSIIGITIILINIPFAYLVLNKQADIENRVYLQINYDGINYLTSIKLESDYFEKNIGDFRSKDSKIIYYYPEYVDKNNRDSYAALKPVKLKLINEDLNQKIELILPHIKKGECRKIYIDNNYKLTATAPQRL